MRSVILSALLVAGCSSQPDHSYSALQYIGLEERRDRTALRELVGVDPVRVEWCAAFVNAVLEQQGVEGSSSVSEYPLTARSFLMWGDRVSPDQIQRGDIVVFPRGNSSWQGHVGFYWGAWTDERGVDYYQILGGNQSNRVGIEMYAKHRAIDIRRARPRPQSADSLWVLARN